MLRLCNHNRNTTTTEAMQTLTSCKSPVYNVRPRECHGFTLVELSTVVLIVIILVSLLSGALNRTKAKSQQLSCLNNNLKELQLSWMLYYDDNDDHLALNKSGPSPLNPRIFGQRNSTNSWVAGNPKEDLDAANIMKGTLFPYLKTPRLYQCPQDSSKVVGHKDIVRTRSYSMNAYLAGDNEGLDPRVKMRSSELVNPSPQSVFVFIEEHEVSIWDSSFVVLPREQFTLTSGSWSSTPADRHDRGCNLSFADGHVEYWRWLWPKSANLNNQTTVNSKELRDLRRLQSSVPKP
jgi:prepilin-type processing-associated H-X9-DG protein